MSSVTQRRRACSVVLSSANDLQVLADDLCPRMRGLKWSTRLSAGFDAASAVIVSAGGSPWLNMGEISQLFRQWRYACLRIYLQSELVWLGRIWKLVISEMREQRGMLQAKLAISAYGPWKDMTLRAPTPDAWYSQEGATVTLSDLAYEFVKQTRSDVLRLIPQSAALIFPTSVNIGPIGVSLSDTKLEILTNQLRSGSGAGQEFWMGCYEGGLILAPRVGATAWRHRLLGSGLDVIWDGDQFAHSCQTLFTDAEGSNDAVDREVGSSTALELHHGVRRNVALNLSNATADSARSAALAFLEVHSDPVGYDGALLYKPGPGQLFGLAETAAGGPAPAYRMRAGQIVELYGLLPDDQYFGSFGRLRNYLIDSAETDLDAGSVSVTPEAQALEARDAENQPYFLQLLSSTSPSDRKRVHHVYRFGDPVTTTHDRDQEPDTLTNVAQSYAYPYVFHPASPATWTFDLTTRFISNGNGNDVTIGITIDSETWDDQDSEVSHFWGADTVAAQSRSYRWPFRQYLTPGEHTVRVWFMSTVDAGSFREYILEVTA